MRDDLLQLKRIEPTIRVGSHGIDQVLSSNTREESRKIRTYFNLIYFVRKTLYYSRQLLRSLCFCVNIETSLCSQKADNKHALKKLQERARDNRPGPAEIF